MTEEQCAELHRQVEEEAAPYWKGNSKDAAEELAALKEWKAGAEKTLLENAALLEQAEKMILAAKDEIAKLREALLTIRNYSHACFYEGAHGDRRFDSLARMSAVALIIEEK